MGRIEIRVIALGTATLALLLPAAGCGGSGRPRDGAADRPGVAVDVFPAPGAAQVAPELPVMVGVAGGVLRSVSVRSASHDVPLAGVYSADRTRWRSRRAMIPGETYRVTVAAVDPDGRIRNLSGEFTTIKAAQLFALDRILPNKEMTGLTVGVGMPIMLTFDRPIADRVSVERSLQVQASRPVEGAWHWLDEKSVAFRPRKYWPAHTQVRLVAQLAGVRGGPGSYGAQDYVRDFTVGRSQISHADTVSHHMTVKRNGRVIRTVPISAGEGGDWRHYTTSGVHLAMSREDVTTMTNPDAGPGSAGYYSLTVYDTVRISDTGEYIHGAPWSVGSQGNANVSHGCVNVSPENAKWFKETTLIGDPIIVSGTPRRLDPGNGWGYWQENWKQWLRWSGLRGAITTEPLAGRPPAEHRIAAPTPPRKVPS
ncbi:hypothetical protein Sru01_10280 [Sphaerisporangium rufum]|uniref:L,D-TPase catalytic domain-containing protein n=1 Tax=Sphaerisporangium rufum TaxID=1381558 RepID=A0A919UWI3_9ACTN|nr:Ig-like domain-containing protein [Sphaerisporangium rufum]GII76046.1 hypothetical protein Sru01_10280 [Sphaerisporangium rufum]